MVKILSLFVVVLLIISSFGVNALNSDIKQMKLEIPDDGKIISEGSGYTHTVLVGVATSQNCAPCGYMNSFIYSLFNNQTHDFHYVDMIIYDYNGNILNSWANYWANRYNIYKQPALVFDGGYKKHTGYQSLDQIPLNIELCGNRDVWDITSDMNVLWMGDATIQIDISIKNNENEDYKFYLRAFVTEKNSRYKTYFYHLYHYGFLDFAIFGNTVTISPGETYTTSKVWNGNEHEDGHGNDFGDISQNNVKVITGIYRGGTSSHYLDQTLAATPTTGYMPNKPSKPSGNTYGNIGVEYSYSSYTTDPQGGDIYYWFDWGDDNSSDWIGPIESGETVESSHTWTDEDSYEIRVKAKDPEGHESVWSNPLKVTISKSKVLTSSIFLRFLELFSVIEQLLSL